MYKNNLSVALKGIALAMGVAVTVLNVLGTTTVASSVNLLSFGLIALALAALKQN